MAFQDLIFNRGEALYPQSCPKPHIFICLACPMLLSMLFMENRIRTYTLFVVIGMGMCLSSSYVSSFFMMLYGIDMRTATTEITPACEEIMKLIPLIMFHLIFEPDTKILPNIAIAIAGGFTTFENVCYLTENGADSFLFLLIRGVSAGALHILCGAAIGYALAHIFSHRWLSITGTVGILGACICFHAIFNLLILSEGVWKMIGYLFPSMLIILLFIAIRWFPRLHIKLE